MIILSLWKAGGGGGAVPPCLQVGEPAADINCDGGEVPKIDVVDVQLAIIYALHLPLDPSMDANGNGCPTACEPVCDAMQCDDGVSCTLDLCYEPLGCVFEPDDAQCEPAQGLCKIDECIPGC